MGSTALKTPLRSQPEYSHGRSCNQQGENVESRWWKQRGETWKSTMFRLLLFLPTCGPGDYWESGRGRTGEGSYDEGWSWGHGLEVKVRWRAWYCGSAKMAGSDRRESSWRPWTELEGEEEGSRRGREVGSVLERWVLLKPLCGLHLKEDVSNS